LFHQKSVEKKFVIQMSLLGLFIFFVLCILQILDYSLTHSVKIANIAEEGNFEWQIDLVKVDRNYVAITGWAFVPGQEPNNMAINVVLHNTSTKEAFKLPTVLVDQENINENYGEEIDYSKSGFLSRVNNHFLKLDKYSYEVFLEFIYQDQVFYIETDEILTGLQGE